MINARALAALALLAVAHAQAQTKLQMPMQGEPLPSSNFELVNRIPRSHQRDLPKALPVFRYSTTPRPFPLPALQDLLDRSVFAGTNVANLASAPTNAALLEHQVRLSSRNGLDSFFADPATGGILLQGHGTGADVRRETPAYDSVPKFEALQATLLRYAQTFGVSTNEMERNEDGSVHFLKTDGTTLMRGGAIKFISRRSARVSRTVAGRIFLANDDKIELALGVKGWLQKFELKWPPMVPVRTNALLTAEQILGEIRGGRALADVSNQYPPDGVAQIILKDIRVDYYAYSPRGFGPISTNTDILPVASIIAVFKSKSGKTQEGGLYAPVCAAQ